MKEMFKVARIIACLMLALGLFSLLISAYYNSNISAFIGLGLIFWGALLLYIAPTEYVSLKLLNAIAPSTLVNIEKILKYSDIISKGIYLPPKYLKNTESSLIFIPKESDKLLPSPEEIDEEKLYLENPKGLILTPPGLALSKLFEREIGKSFLRTDLNYIENNMPKLLIENLEIAENIEINTESSIITMEITNHVLNEICQETKKLERTHTAIGCPLCSAIACALAKASGKPITIEKEEISEDEKTTKIQYRVLED